MSKYRRLKPGEIEFEDAGDVDLDNDDHGFTHDGKKLTEADAERLAEEAGERFEEQRAVMGRPSLTAPGEKSPTINARIPRPMKDALVARAKAEGIGEAEVVRRALDEFLSHA